MTGAVLNEKGDLPGPTRAFSERGGSNPRQPLRGLAEAFEVHENTAGECVAAVAVVERHTYTVRDRALLLAMLGLEG